MNWENGIHIHTLLASCIKQTIHENLLYSSGFPDGREPASNAGETWVQSLGREDHLEKGTATHSSNLAWRIPWTDEPGGLQSMGLQSRT